jgi:hypothetical protein
MARRNRNSISVNIDVDMDDIVEALTDEEILEMAENVGHSGSPRAVVSSAVAMIRTGRVADGVAMLEREFFPTWKSKADCEAAYQLAMALKAA